MARLTARGSVTYEPVSMFLSVIIFTRNRASSLQRTVESILCAGNVLVPC